MIIKPRSSEQARRLAMLSAFGSSFGVVSLVAANVWQISHDHIAGANCTQIGIALCWMWNVRTAMTGDFWCKAAYVLGSVVGLNTGYWVTKLFWAARV